MEVLILERGVECPESCLTVLQDAGCAVNVVQELDDTLAGAERAHVLLCVADGPDAVSGDTWSLLERKMIKLLNIIA